MLCDVIPKIASFESKEEDTKRNNVEYRHRCSGATYGEKCPRQQVFHALKVPPKAFSDRFSLVLDDSSWHEHLSADFIRKSGYKLHSEQMQVSPFEINDIPVTGSIDGIITDMQGTDRLYEHKALNHFTFEKFEKGKTFPYDYICQCVMYIIGLAKDTGKHLEGLLLIKNKNTARYIEYLIEYDPQEDIAKTRLYTMDYSDNELGTLKEVKEFFMEHVVEKAKHRFKEIDRYVSENKLPKRQYNLDDDWQCEYCRWSEICWKDYAIEVSKRKDNVTLDNEYIEKVTKYKELGTVENEAKKDRKILKTELKKHMVEKEARTAIAGPYVLELDWVDKPEYTVPASRYENLKFKKLKAAKEKK